MESLLSVCLDEGSMPSGSTEDKNKRKKTGNRCRGRRTALVRGISFAVCEGEGGCLRRMPPAYAARKPAARARPPANAHRQPAAGSRNGRNKERRKKNDEKTEENVLRTKNNYYLCTRKSENEAP